MNDEAQCEAALPGARPFWALREFTDLPVPARTAFLHAVALCAWNPEDSAAASAADAAGQLGADWSDYMRLQIGVRFDNDALAVQGFEAMVEAQPQAAAELAIRFVWGVLRAARDTDPSGAAALRVHDRLVAINYTPPDDIPDEALRLAHVRLLLQHGEAARASARIGVLRGPRNVLAVRVDRLFDPRRGDDETLVQRAVLRERLGRCALARTWLAPSRLSGASRTCRFILSIGAISEPAAASGLTCARPARGFRA